MRPLILFFLFAVSIGAHAQFNAFTGYYSYAFIEDCTALIPLQGGYSLEYLIFGW